MCRYELRIPLGLGQELLGAVVPARGPERVAFGLISHVDDGDTCRLFLRRVLPLPEEAYVHGSQHGAEWRGTAMVPVIEAAMDEGLGVVLFHSHPWTDPPRMSRDDLVGAHRLLPMLHRRVPARPHGSVVLGPASAVGFIQRVGSEPTLHDVPIRWMGSAVMAWPRIDDGMDDRSIFERQMLVVGGQGRLRAACVAVVGLGGGGSHAVQQLAHAGVGTVIGVDADLCDGTNLHRLVGMRREDIERPALKVDVMARMVREIGTGTRFIGVDARIPEARALEALGRADVIVGCVDSLQARADVQEFAWRRVIPYVDVGVSIRAVNEEGTGPRASVGGNVLVLIPGGFCMWCCGFLSEEKLAAERGGKPRGYFENTKGEAQVISFNGLVASQAVTEVLQLLTGFRGECIDPASLAFGDGQQRGVLKLDGARGTLEDWGAHRRSACAICGAVLGAGSVAWTQTADVGMARCADDEPVLLATHGMLPLGHLHD